MTVRRPGCPRLAAGGPCEGRWRSCSKRSSLFAATLKENIAYGRPDATDEEIEAAAKLARIHHFINRLPEQYDTWVGERGANFSGGQKQRIAIARALLMDPRVLIFDDSTSSVDAATEFEIQQAMAALMRGRTTFVIAHRLRSLRDADQILVLDQGEIVQRGKHDELLGAGRFVPRDLRVGTARPGIGPDPGGLSRWKRLRRRAGAAKWA